MLNLRNRFCLAIKPYAESNLGQLKSMHFPGATGFLCGSPMEKDWTSQTFDHRGKTADSYTLKEKRFIGVHGFRVFSQW